MNLPTVTEAIPPYHVIVQFGSGIPSDEQSKVLFDMELTLRKMGVPAEVYKPTHADDSKLRRSMTPEQRARL